MKIKEKNSVNTTLQVRIPQEELEKIKEAAKKRNLSMSVIVRQLIKEFLNDPQGKIIF